jgi:hypothetical protein
MLFLQSEPNTTNNTAVVSNDKVPVAVYRWPRYLAAVAVFGGLRGFSLGRDCLIRS